MIAFASNRLCAAPGDQPLSPAVLAEAALSSRIFAVDLAASTPSAAPSSERIAWRAHRLQRRTDRLTHAYTRQRRRALAYANLLADMHAAESSLGDSRSVDGSEAARADRSIVLDALARQFEAIESGTLWGEGGWAWDAAAGRQWPFRCPTAERAAHFKCAKQAKQICASRRRLQARPLRPSRHLLATVAHTRVTHLLQ